MTAMVDEVPKKKTRKKTLEAPGLSEEAVDAVLHVVEAPKDDPKPKPKPKPGAKGFEWKLEYPGEEVYVYTAPSGTTIGLTKLGPHRKPKPGLLRRLHREGGMSVMWYFIELASSPAALKLQEELEEEDYTEMIKGWADFAGIELNP